MKRGAQKLIIKNHLPLSLAIKLEQMLQKLRETHIFAVFWGHFAQRAPPSPSRIKLKRNKMLLSDPLAFHNFLIRENERMVLRAVSRLTNGK